MKIPLVCALLMIGTVLQGAEPVSTAEPVSKAKPVSKAEPVSMSSITDGTSLAEGLKLFRLVKSGGEVTLEQSLRGFCADAYVDGFWGGCGMWIMHGSETPFVVPNGVTRGEFQKIVEKWLQDHPEALHERANHVLLLALSDAYPNPAYKKPIPREGGK